MTSVLDITVFYALLDTILPKPLSSSSQINVPNYAGSSTGVPSMVVTVNKARSLVGTRHPQRQRSTTVLQHSRLYF
ncbi:BQ2448_5904 [Microbotryum intermedium]|uniref:BQ2448_5904 protein n=1 Tax=Microbotryum intermedium TaxID=269621 RepID=A0A238F7V7_9BASI|nr:BQ2448_5904 [Microbotryum intermedium]